ncbi:uncharacterized protein [Argopecten irradians]|uniref:uncharacterized protein n=1 Tax=Argopecten irradians TaxID=31199 RepID=UPI00371C236D
MAAPTRIIQHLILMDYLISDSDDETISRHKYMMSAMALHIQKANRPSVPKINTYMGVIDDMILPENVDDFKTHYRLSRDMFDCLLERVRDDLIKDFRGGRCPINPDKQLLVFLNYLGNQQSMRECAHIFGLSKSTVHSIVTSVTEAIVKLQSQVIRWPDADRQREIAREVEDSVGIPGVVGFIDGTHIRLASAPGGEREYYNRKKFPSIQLQAVVDNNLMITNAYCGWPGCTHDARVLRNSELFSKAENGTLFLQDHFSFS